jgi:hypothetical protein
MKRIPDFSTYSITKDGRIYSHRLRPGWLAPTKDKNGYIRYHGLIRDNGLIKAIYAHQAVARTYIVNLANKPFVNHLDHDKSNNSTSNLEWCTQKENIIYDWAKGKRPKYFGTANKNSKVTPKLVQQIRKLYSDGVTQINISKKFGISQPTVSQIILKKTWGEL